MRTSVRLCLGIVTMMLAMGWLLPSPHAQSSAWTPPKTPWGHPDMQGIYTNKDEANTPLERPDEFKGRAADSFSAADLSRLAKNARPWRRRSPAASAARRPALVPRIGTSIYREWQPRVADPRSARRQASADDAARAQARSRLGRAPQRAEWRRRRHSWLDRSLYDRCITRGLPGSMMPAIYGNSYEIIQAPDSVAIRYEMIHEARVIPLDGRPHVGQAIREYVGDARARWDGNTLVVETTNFTDRTHMGYNFRYNSEKYTLTERFTPVAPNRLQWQVTIADPDTWTRPWTFTMPLTSDDSQQVFEYACHEGNRGLEHILKGARAEERAARR